MEGNKSREAVLEDVLKLQKPNCLLELPTGFGKSFMAIKKIESLYNKDMKTLLIVVPRNIHKKNWADEVNKWWEDCPLDITYTTYASFPKYVGEWDFCIFDECFRGDVEVLTNEGFKRFDSLTGEEEIAQFNQDSSIEFVKPTRFIKRHHDGELCKLTLGRGRSVYMTPNHYQPHRTPYQKEWNLKPIEDLTFNGYNRIPVSGISKNDGEHLSWLEKAIIAIQADGTLQRHQINESVYSIQVTKQRKKDRLKFILDNIGSYTSIKGREDVDRYMVKLPKGDAKLLSTHFSVNMGKTKAREFIEEIVQWDGCEKLAGNTLYYSSKIKENVDFVNAIAVQAGYKCLQSIEENNRKENYSTMYRLYMRPNTLEVHTVMPKEYIPYFGDVYCVEVPSHMIVVRSEGYTFVSGNCHHISERCREAIVNFAFKNTVLLSATVGRELKQSLKYLFHDIDFYSVGLRDAIDDGVLPDPKVFLIPLILDNNHPTESIWKNKSAKGQLIECSWANRWSYIRQKACPVRIYCTQKQYVDDLNSQIEWWKRNYMRTRNQGVKNKWLMLCTERLKYLSNLKNTIIYNLLENLKNKRTLTFCNSIEQTEILGKHCINSKDKNAIKYYNDFNEGKIKHITACNMLNEGLNLKNCQIGIYANLNSSETIVKQRAGRLLRHKNPIIIIPYFVNTREQELVEKMLENYNKELITIVNDINEMKLT